MKKSPRVFLVATTMYLAAATGCADDGAMGIPGTMGAPGPGVSVLRLSLTGLSDVGAGSAYEGWLIPPTGDPVSTGVFHVDSEGHQTASTFAVAEADLATATAFVLTIEPSPDSDPAPASTHVLAGAFANDEAPLSVGHSSALGSDFMSAAGSYILNTPSTAADATDYANGIWWLDPDAGPGASLTLPSLPSGWAYEGWIVDPVEGPISTGTFTMATGADSDGGGATAGPDGIPLFPGADFIDPARALTQQHAAVISVEPVPDMNLAPFALKPLVDSSIELLGLGVSQSMNNNAANAPTGTASR